MSNSYRYPLQEEMSPACLRQFQECKALSNSSVLLFPKPEGCWKDWAEACVIPVSNTDLLALIAVIIIIAFFSFIGNTIVCVVFCLYDQLRLVKHYFVINLAVIDDVLALISVPMFAAYVFGGQTDILLCRTQILVDVFCGTASIISLAVISIERYFAVVVPLHYEQHVTPYRAVLIIIFTWFYSAMVSLIILLSYAVPSSPANTSKNACLFFGGEFVILVTIASFVLPVCVMAWAYWNIFVVAYAHARQIQAMVPSTQQLPQNTAEGGNTTPQVRMQGELKAAKTLTSIMATHILCWCPLFVYFMVISFCWECKSDASKIANYIIMVLRYCNTLANPIIYTGINRQFRGAIKKFLLRKRGNEELNATVYTQAT